MLNILESRNKVHLVGLKKHGDFFEKKDVEMVFAKSSAIINAIEEKLRAIPSR